MTDPTISAIELDRLVESGEISPMTAVSIHRDPLQWIVSSETWIVELEKSLSLAKSEAALVREARNEALKTIKELEAKIEMMVSYVVQAKKIANAMTATRQALAQIVDAADLDNAAMAKIGIAELASAVDLFLDDQY